MPSRSTSSSSGTERVWTLRICAGPRLSGGCTATRRSKRPGRSSAVSRTPGRFVAARTITPRRRVEAVHLGQDLVERLLALVVAAAEADAAGARAPDRVELVDEDDRRRGSLACLKRSRTREAPTPTIASTNSDAEIEKNGTPASPATALRQQRLAGAGRAREQHAARDPPAEPAVAVGVLEEVDDLGQLLLRLVDAGHVGERDRAARRSRRAARASARTPPSAPIPPPRRRRAGRGTRTARPAAAWGRSRG